ncbi:YbaB/EbfC family nucleoid-associated protein [Amycolatopsis cynarae]|uniref:YbaB/EbfC family nucleoid-associated protein n=1 Tax=Amycolatopsis cynarae TaxID=2995223 RepID=A0ABY7AWG8_9PSEU|nr:YbaB/EbfC family nucleoid-associated protein [Amycolatopsis sp. HUAS 11-8]WAL64064.1 YbaB/EbfC family nucleoid-associated protein [Amycolatopsis sp. HUAS 11-8]
MASDDLKAAEERLAGYATRVQEIQQRAERSQEQIKTLRARAESPDGAVRVVLAPGGRLEDLTLSPQALRLGHDRLAAAIKQTVQAAHADAARQTQAALQPLLGQSAAMEFLAEQLDTGLAEEQAENAPRRRAGGGDSGDEDGEFGGPFLRRS